MSDKPTAPDGWRIISGWYHQSKGLTLGRDNPGRAWLLDDGRVVCRGRYPLDFHVVEDFCEAAEIERTTAPPAPTESPLVLIEALAARVAELERRIGIDPTPK